MTAWPDASLDPIRRAMVLGESLPGAAWAETVLDVPFDQVWPWVTDFEHSVPSFDGQVDRIRVRSRQRVGDAEEVRMTAWSFGGPVRFEARVEEGFCLMAARVYLVVMAARPEGDRTRFLHLEAVPLSGGRLLRPLLQRAVRADLRGIHRELGG